MTLQAMTLDLEALNANIEPVPGFSVQRVHSSQQLRQFIDILAANSNTPKHIADAWFDMEQSLGTDQIWPRQLFLGFLDEKPIATCSLMIGANVAGLYHVATLPEARGRGIGSAISLAVVQVAQVLGYQKSVLISTPMGANIYRRLGYEPVDDFNLYYWSAGETYV